MAALPKLQQPGLFAESIAGYRLFTPLSIAWIAITIPWLELIVGIGLLAPQTRRAAGILIASLLVVFIGLHTSAWLRGLDIACGCFGEHEANEVSYLWPILRNFTLFVAAVCVLIRDCRHHTSSQRPA